MNSKPTYLSEEDMIRALGPLLVAGDTTPVTIQGNLLVSVTQFLLAAVAPGLSRLKAVILGLTNDRLLMILYNFDSGEPEKGTASSMQLSSLRNISVKDSAFGTKNLSFSTSDGVQYRMEFGKGKGALHLNRETILSRLLELGGKDTSSRASGS